MKKTLEINNPAERKLGFVTSFFGGGAFQLILFEWVEDEPLNNQSQAEVADYEGRSVVNEILCHVVYVEYTRNGRKIRERWFFGINDNLPRKFELLAVDDRGRHGAYVLTISDLKTDKNFNDSAFKIEPPTGYTVKLYEPPKRPMLLPINTAAPDWELFDSINREHSLSNYQGKVVIMDFWATWCGPCIKAMPDLQKLYEKFKSLGVEVFGINVWEESNAPAYFKQNGFNYKLLLNGEETAKAYQVNTLPTLYIIGIDGKVIYRTTGSHKEVETILEQYLKRLEIK